MISGQSLTCPKGASLTFEIDMDTGSDLTGATAQWALCESWFDQAKVYLTKTGTVDGLFIGQDAGIWKITINLAPSDTVDIPSGLLYHDCKVLLQNGDVEDVANGPFLLSPSVNILLTDAPITRNLRSVPQPLSSLGQTATATVGALGRNLQAAQSLAGVGQTAAATVAPADIDVLIEIGQSNATGQQTDMSDVSYSSDSNIISWNGSAFQTYLPNTFTGVDSDIATSHWAAEKEYALQFRAANPGKKLAIIKYAMGATYLYQSGDGATTQDWNVSSTGELYSRAVTFVTNALANLSANGYTPTVRFIWWMQGESDALDATRAAAYETNLTAFVTAARSSMGLGAGRFVIGQITDAFTFASTVKTAQANVAAADPGGPVDLIATSDLALNLLDNTHYTADSQTVLGARLWTMVPILPVGVDTIFQTDLTALSSLPTGMIDARLGHSMVHDATGQLTFAPANAYLDSASISSWNGEIGATITNSASDPWGGTTAFTVIEDTSTGLHGADATRLPGGSVVVGQRYQSSFYMKAAGRTIVRVSFYGFADYLAFIDLTTGAVSGASGGTSPLLIVDSDGGGWWRIVLCDNATVASSEHIIFFASTGTTISYAGDGASGVVVAGRQLEPITYETTARTYNPTVAGAYYGPRFDHDPSTLAALGLLLEEERSSLFVGTGSPENQTVTVASGTVYTVSFYGTGTLTLTGATTHAITGTSATALASYTFTASTTSLNIAVSGSVTYPNVEAGAFPTSRISTISAAVTRSADVTSAISTLRGFLSAGPSVWEMMDEATGTTTRSAYAANAFSWPVNKWYRSMGVYPAGTDTSGHMTVGSPY